MSRTSASAMQSVEDLRATVRCAIYTRKSTDEGLDQDFNSLDAQRESAEAYIASQRHEKWLCISERYDDGGFTGGNMERPALKRLIADIEAGGIDCVVVYKVDRLSRSLLDFSRLMELFDKHAVSFVSVTQQFNTTSSMGRLTLNILFSFAQFEREIISERTRDKMSAARKKGKWVGGTPVLGYDVDPKGGRLIINEDEAARVRAIYDLYMDRKALMPVVSELERRKWGKKQWTTKRGDIRGGNPFTKNSLYRLLTSVVYTGNVDYKGTIYKGEHEGIVDPDLWQRVQDTLRHNGRSGAKDVRNKYGALLRGLLYCAPCRAAMVHSYTVRNGKCYRYYVCLTAQQRGWTACPTKSVNAHEMEVAVIDYIRGLGSNIDIFSETVSAVRDQNENRLHDLETERRANERELKRLDDRLHALVSDNSALRTDSRLVTDQMADLQDRIRFLEQRMTVIREEIIDIQRKTLDEEDLKKALNAFDPVWESLAPREQARILKTLIERVAYDGRDGKVTVTFRSPGIKALCMGDEVRMLEEHGRKEKL